MAYATGTRLASAACWILGGITIIGAPILWPLGHALHKAAKEKEEEREAELEAATA